MSACVSGTTEAFKQVVREMEEAGPGATGSRMYRGFVAELERRRQKEAPGAAVTATEGKEFPHPSSKESAMPTIAQHTMIDQPTRVRICDGGQKVAVHFGDDTVIYLTVTEAVDLVDALAMVLGSMPEPDPRRTHARLIALGDIRRSL